MSCIRLPVLRLAEEVFLDKPNMPLIHVRVYKHYARLLTGVTDSEEKRRCIGTKFWRAFFEEAQKLYSVRFIIRGIIDLDIIESADSMAADWAWLPQDVLVRISGCIVGEVPEVDRVIYDMTLEPPAAKKAALGTQQKSSVFQALRTWFRGAISK